MHKTARIRLLGFMILCLLVTGCASKQLFYLSPRFHELDLGRVCVLPVVDKRMDKSQDLDLKAAMQERVYKKVKKKGYDVSTASTFAATGDVTADAITRMSQQEVSNLGPTDATTLLIVYLLKAHGSYSVMKYRFEVSAEAALIHKPSKTILWKAYGEGHDKQEGLISGLLVPLIRRNAFHYCVDHMMKSLPKKNATNIIKGTAASPQPPLPSAAPPSTATQPPPSPQSQAQDSAEEAGDERGIINITTDPPGAKVFIDGEYKGLTPAEISLTIGTYQIFLQRQLYEPYKDSVTIENGQTKKLNIKLSPEGKEQK